MTLIKGKLWVESPDASCEVGPGDSVYFPGKRAPQGRSHRDETVELYCIIDCRTAGELLAEAIVKIADCGTN